MKTLLNKIYFLFFGPIYSRLSRDCSLRMQELTRVQMEFQEKWSRTISDELVALSLKAHADTLNQEQGRSYSMGEVIDITGRIHKSADLVLLSEQLNIPLDDLSRMYLKYGHVNRAGIARIMELEQQIKDLSSLSAPVLAKIEKTTGGMSQQSHLTSASGSSGENHGDAH